MRVNENLSITRPWLQCLSPEFRATMLEHEEDLARNMVESLLVYAMGRDIEFTDELHIKSIMTQLRPDGFRLKDMIHAVASSPLFLQN